MDGWRHGERVSGQFWNDDEATPIQFTVGYGSVCVAFIVRAARFFGPLQRIASYN